MSIVRMSLGATTGAAQQSPELQSSIPASTRYYADFESYLVAMLGFAHVAEASNNGNVTRYRREDSIRLSCKIDDGSWYWHPEPTVSLLSRNFLTTELFLARHRSTRPPANEVLNLGSIGALLHNFGQALATNYYERLKPSIDANYGTATINWPPIWQFARVVRNAMSHGGVITFTNPNAPPVSWKGVTYTPADNGRAILHTDLWLGDIFDLIIEIDNEVGTIL